MVFVYSFLIYGINILMSIDQPQPPSSEALNITRVETLVSFTADGESFQGRIEGHDASNELGDISIDMVIESAETTEIEALKPPFRLRAVGAATVLAAAGGSILSYVFEKTGDSSSVGVSNSLAFGGAAGLVALLLGLSDRAKTKEENNSHLRRIKVLESLRAMISQEQ